MSHPRGGGEGEIGDLVGRGMVPVHRGKADIARPTTSQSIEPSTKSICLGGDFFIWLEEDGIFFSFLFFVSATQL